MVACSMPRCKRVAQVLTGFCAQCGSKRAQKKTARLSPFFNRADGGQPSDPHPKTIFAASQQHMADPFPQPPPHLDAGTGMFPTNASEPPPGEPRGQTAAGAADGSVASPTVQRLASGCSPSRVAPLGRCGQPPALKKMDCKVTPKKMSPPQASRLAPSSACGEQETEAEAVPPVQVQHRSTASRASSAFDPWQPPQGAPMVATGTPPASPVGSVAAPPAAEVDESTKGVRLAAAAVDEAGDVCVAAKEAAGAGAARLASEGAIEADAARLATIADARVDVAPNLRLTVLLLLL